MLTLLAARSSPNEGYIMAFIWGCVVGALIWEWSKQSVRHRT